MSCTNVSLYPTSSPLSQSINLNSLLQGQVSYQLPIDVNLRDSLGNPITPTGSALVGNTLTATLATPNPSGVALQFPNPSQGVTYSVYDTGWRAQNGWYTYTPPTYPAKYAQLDTTAGANQWYRLKTALTVGGVNSTQRFVDVNGVQSWGTLNNENFAVVDKLTGLMFTRTPIGVGAGSSEWRNNMINAFNYSITINGVVYSDWYAMSASEMMATFGLYVPASSSWLDGITGQAIITGINSIYKFYSADTDVLNTTILAQTYFPRNASGGIYSVVNTNESNAQMFWVHKATNLIS
jgi:hypothetical protein